MRKGSVLVLIAMCFGYHGGSQAQTTIVEKTARDDWQILRSRSPVDDTETVQAVAAATEVAMDRFGRRTTPELNLVCLEGRTNLYLNVPGYFFADNENWGEVTVRIGNAKARVIAMQRSTNREAIGLWNGRGIALAKTMDGKAQFLWRVTPYGENAETFVFGGSGFSAALREVKKACKW